MTRAAPAQAKIPTESPQPSRKRDAPAGGRPKKASSAARSRVLAGSTARAATRGGGEVIELECGITVYPARSEGGRWRAVWDEDGERQQCEAATEEKLGPKLEKVAERLRADAPNMRRPGADLIAHYLNPDRLPVQDRWSRRHADTQRRLCERFAAPVIASVTCQDIKTEHTQRIVNAAPTAGEGDRVHRMISALVTAGIDGGYLANPRLADGQLRRLHRPAPGSDLPLAQGKALGLLQLQPAGSCLRLPGGRLARRRRQWLVETGTAPSARAPKEHSILPTDSPQVRDPGGGPHRKQAHLARCVLGRRG
jgi:hypothetical protein